MYFPLLRGRQFELIALRELIDNSLIGNSIIPIIEPVKMSSTLIKTLNTFCEKNKEISFIFNPIVGNFISDFKKEANIQQAEQLKKILKSPNIIATQYLNNNSKRLLEKWINEDGKKVSDIMVISNDEDTLPIYNELFEKEFPRYTLIPDEREFRREIHCNKVLIDDKFIKQNRNTDYAKKPDEHFSNDHLYYKMDGYIGFSDYSVIGDDYSDTGFAPYAVVIHIVYFDDNMKLRVRHFVSDTNDDISDPAKKFSEAVTKLIQWNNSMNLDTFAMRQFEEMYEKEVYPGLGTIKKLSLMHHIELMSSFLGQENLK